MKFYKDIMKFDYWKKIKNNKLNAIYSYYRAVRFYKNGLYHNPKNADYIGNDGSKDFSLNNKCYGNHNHFTKQSWRRFVKLQAFL